MPCPKQKCFFLFSQLQHYITLPCLFIFICCNQQQSKQTSHLPVSKNKAADTVWQDHVPPPKVVLITSANQPKVVKAGKPIIRIDSTDGGVPFFTNYNTDQGLPMNFVTCAFQDTKGNIWIGTGGGGAVRYDGQHFTAYTSAQGLPDNFIETILQDKDGNIWFGTLGHGASRYDGKTFTNFSTTEGMAGTLVTGMVQSNDADIWFATDNGVSRYNGKSFTSYTAAQGLAGNDVRSILKDKEGNIWFGCTGAGLSRYNGNSFTSFTVADGLPGNAIRGLMQCQNGDIWITTCGSGASCYNGKTFTNYSTAQGLASNILSSAFQDKTGNIWFGTFGAGVSLYNGKTFTSYTTIHGLAGNNLFSIMQDKGGKIWLSTLGGLSVCDGKIITHFNAANGLAGNTVENIIQANDGTIWLGCFGDGITTYDGKAFSSLNMAQGLVNNFVLCVMQDKNNNIWIGTNNGASRYDGKSFTSYTAAQGLKGSISGLLQDKNGNIWFSSNGNGVYKDDGNSFTNYTTAQGLLGNYVNDMMQDINGDIWFGINGGISRYSGKSIINYTTKNGLAARSVYCSATDKNGNIWFGSGISATGASMYNGNAFTNYAVEDGIADNDIEAMAPDPKRNTIWLGTNLGLSCLKQNSSPGKDSFVFNNYNIGTGYPIKNLNGKALLVDNKGVIWAGCENDLLLRFNYDAVVKNTLPMPLQIDAIKVNGEIMCWNNLKSINHKPDAADSLALINEMATSFGKILSAPVLDSLRKKYKDIRFDSITPYYPIPVNLVVPYQDRNLTFEFAAIEPDKPKQVQYQYMLEGYNKQWSLPDNNTTAVFGNIPGGSYTFKLKAVSPYGVWSETSYRFTVLPPWWQTWWAYILYIIGFGGCIFLIARYQHRHLLYKERERNKLLQLEMQALRAQMNPHFIFNCLNSINRFVLMNETEAASDYLTKFSRLIRMVLNNSKKSLIALEDELEMLRLYIEMEKLRFKDGFEYRIDVEDNIASKSIFIPPLLFQPFAENAVWHGLMHKKEHGQLNIKLSIENNLLYFSIEDNGVGRAASSQSGSKAADKNKSLGLQITKSRLSLINGYTSEKTFFEIEDLYNAQGEAAGTRVVLKIKFSETQDSSN